MFSLFFRRRTATSRSKPVPRSKPLTSTAAISSGHSHPETPASKTAAHQNTDAAVETVFDGRDMEKLYHQGEVLHLQAGEVLHRSDEVANCLYVVLKGALRTSRDDSTQRQEVSILRKGSWIVDVDLSKKRLWGYSAIASEPAAVMRLTQSMLNAMDESLRLRLSARIHRLHCAHIDKLAKQNRDYAERTDKLVSGMALLQHSDIAALEHSSLIKGILKKIPKLPVSTSALVNKLMDAKASTREVVELVKMDPSLTAELLKTINSARYRFDNQISDVNHAVVMLGYDGVYQMVMAEGIRKSLPETDEFTAMYDRSLALSNIAFAVSQASGIGRPSEMATIALLHDIGLVVIGLLKNNNPAMTVLINLLDSGDMGALLLRSWGIPEIVNCSIAQQHRPQVSPPAYIDAEVRESVSILYVSGLIFDVMQGHCFGDLPTLFLDEYLALLQWQDKSLNEIGFDVVVPILKKRRDLLPPQLRQIVA